MRGMIRRLVVAIVVIVAGAVSVWAIPAAAAPRQLAVAPSTAASQSLSPTSDALDFAPASDACDPGADSNPFHILKVTLTCIVTGQVFYDPDLKLKSRCIASVGFDAVTDLIPAAKVKLLEKASVPIGRSAGLVARDVKALKIEDATIIDGLDSLGKAVTLVRHSPKEVIELFLTSDTALKALGEKLAGHPDAVAHLATLQHQLGDLFTSLTGLDDIAKCKAAFSHPTTRTFLGDTSEGDPVQLQVQPNGTTFFKISYESACTDEYGDPTGSASGWFSTGNASTGPSGSLDYSTVLNNVLTDQGDQTFNGTYDLQGDVSGTHASGTFSFLGHFYDLDGDYVGDCGTGQLSWSASS